MKFKLYKSIDYCEDSNVYMLIKDAILETWSATSLHYNNSQLYRIRYKILSPKTKISDILLYAVSNNNQKRYFLNYFSSLLKAYFPAARFKNWVNNPDGFEIKESTTLLNLYNLLKNVPIDKHIKIDEHIKWVNSVAEAHYD